MKLPNTCQKHKEQKELKIQENILKSGDHTFRVKCYVCGKLGPKSASIYKSILLWNETNSKEEA